MTLSEQINLRLDSIDRLIAERGRQMDAQFSQMQAQMNTMFRWMIGLQLMTLLAVIIFGVILFLK